MKVSAFTIARNAVKFDYPMIESIQSILPIVDEFIVNIGDSQDGTLSLIQSIKDKKIRIIQNRWDMSRGSEVLSYQTNLALKECQGDWAFYLQSDEVVHEGDLPRIRRVMEMYVNHPDVDALRFGWFHFYGSYWRYRIDSGWYQKQDRVIKNNRTIRSTGDAWAFERTDGRPLKVQRTGAFIYHYGWVQSPEVMARRRMNAETIGFVQLKDDERNDKYAFGNLERFPSYFGTHPQVMQKRISEHALSGEDKSAISRKWWWYPPHVFKIRYKTGRRVKGKI